MGNGSVLGYFGGKLMRISAKIFNDRAPMLRFVSHIPRKCSFLIVYLPIYLPIDISIFVYGEDAPVNFNPCKRQVTT